MLLIYLLPKTQRAVSASIFKFVLR